MIHRIVRRAKTKVYSFLQKCKKKVPVYIPVLQSDLLIGRKALITGGTGGIGFAIAAAFLRAGASVVITGRDKERLSVAIAKLKPCCREGAVVDGLVLDNIDVKSFPRKIQDCRAKMGGLDILVNNAGVVKGVGFGSTKESDYDAILDTNLKGAYFLSQQCACMWRDDKVKSNILNVCSASSLRPGQNPYILSKWGLRALTMGLAKSFARYGVVVNGIAPGPADTESMTHGGDGIDWNPNPAQRLVTREEIANLSVVLVSDLSRMVVGDILYVSGGAGVVTFDDV